MRTTKVFSVNTELNKVTGVQKVLTDIHNGLKRNYDAKILGFDNYDKINPSNNISKEEYLRLRNPFVLRNSIIIIHERKLNGLFLLMNTILFLNMRIIYIHHSVFHNKRRLTFFPKNIVSISDKVTENLLTFFKVPASRITKIHNGIVDRYCCSDYYSSTKESPDIIKVIYVARMNDGKRQGAIFYALKDRLDKRIQIIFAGDGPNLEKVRKLVGDNSQFKILGFVENVPQLIKECDYMLLYSVMEGLPITLIEATMCGKPLILNDVGGNLEIGIPNENAFIVSDWEDLISTLNHLPDIKADQYERMSKKSREIYEEKFQYETMIVKYKNLIDKIIAKK